MTASYQDGLIARIAMFLDNDEALLARVETQTVAMLRDYDRAHYDEFEWEQMIGSEVISVLDGVLVRENITDSVTARLLRDLLSLFDGGTVCDGLGHHYGYLLDEAFPAETG